MVCLESKKCNSLSGGAMEGCSNCVRPDRKDAKKMGGTVRGRKKDNNWRATLENCVLNVFTSAALFMEVIKK